MKQQYRQLQAKILKLAAEWEPLLDLPGIAVEHKFHETALDPENADNTGAVTKATWPYRWALIHWYMPSICHVDDEELEGILVHEYVHVLNNPVSGRLKAGSDDHLEAATENVARALLAVRKDPA